MSATIVSDLTIRIANNPLDGKNDLPLLCELDVDMGVQQQAMVRMQLAAGQDANGDWARTLVRKYKVGTPISVDASIGSAKQRLINGILTQSKLNFSAEIHDSRLEITGIDVLENVKRSHHPQNYSGELEAIVCQILDRQKIPLGRRPDPALQPKRAPSGPPAAQINATQTDSDLDFLIELARKYNREIYVESTKSGDTAYFQRPDFATAPAIGTDLRVNVGSLSNVFNSRFSIDLSGPTRVEANNIDKHGNNPSRPIFSDLRNTPGISPFELDLLGPVNFTLVSRLNRESENSIAALQKRCNDELEKSAWVVVGTGELDTAAYGDLLFPRRTVNVVGAGSLFDGMYMVWKVTHSFKREAHCQKFELRRKLGMMRHG